MQRELVVGVNPQSMHAERVDGFNPLAVADATARKKEILLKGEGPVLMDTITYRFSGHSPSDAMTYRSKEEVDAFKEQDPLYKYGEYLVENNVATADELKAMSDSILAKLKTAITITVDEKISPMVDGDFIESVMFSNQNIPVLDDREVELSEKLGR